MLQFIRIDLIAFKQTCDWGELHEALSVVDRGVKRGDITLITPTNPHKVRDIDSLIIYNVMFETEAIDDEMLNTVLLKNARINSAGACRKGSLPMRSVFLNMQIPSSAKEQKITNGL